MTAKLRRLLCPILGHSWTEWSESIDSFVDGDGIEHLTLYRVCYHCGFVEYADPIVGQFGGKLEKVDGQWVVRPLPDSDA